jgi:glycosyltransferase involved in cell wall biosynthesis
MNILALNWNDLKNPYAGGAEVHLEELLRRLVSYGHQVTLFCSGYSGCLPEEVVEGIRIIRRGSRQNFNLIAPIHLRRLVRENKFDILVEDINKIPFYTPLYLKIRTLVVIPHLFATSVFQEINFVIGTYIYLAERPLVTVYRGKPFNVISESTADDIAKRGVPREDISVIHCGIDRELYSYDQSIPKYEDPTILYLGRVKKYKSVQHLILAFKQIKEQVPESKLMIVGTGDYLPELIKLARSLGLENEVDFPGFVSTEEKVERMRRSWVAVMPSLKEGWGLTNIEANSVGTCVVAANVPGLRDSVKNGETGLLYPYGDVHELAGSLLKIIRDDAYRERLEAGAMKWAETFNWDSAARKFEKLLFEVMEKYS